MNLLDEYQGYVSRTCMPLRHKRHYLVKGSLGVCSEAGEIAGIIEKYRFQGHKLDDQGLALELGDVVWYVTLMAAQLGLSLEEIILSNMEKLKARYQDEFTVEESIERKDVCTGV